MHLNSQTKFILSKCYVFLLIIEIIKNREICFYFSRNLTAKVTKTVFSNLIRSLIMCLGTLTGRNRMT